MKNKAILIAMIVLAALACGFAVWKLHAPTPATQTTEHTWTPFQNSVLGISLEYPSDMLAPEEGAATATSSASIVFKGDATPNAARISIGTEATDAKTIAEYFATPGIQTPVPPTPITIGGLPAMELDEMAYADYQMYLIRSGKLYVITINLPADEAQHVKNSIAFEPDLSAYVGQITNNADGSRTYTSSKYGISFTFPGEWYVGDNHLGYGSFQLSNYDPNDPNLPAKDSMAPGYAKIEIVISDAAMSEPTSDYPEQSRNSQHVTVAGQSGIATEVTYAGGNKSVSYGIALPDGSGKYLFITAHAGNDAPTQASAFKTLDTIVKSITWK